MLISMPTGTSTIFGVFQAIWLSLLTNRTRSALAHKLVSNGKFANEIFAAKAAGFLVAARKKLARFPP
jgi:hypothetical protein